MKAAAFVLTTGIYFHWATPCLSLRNLWRRGSSNIKIQVAQGEFLLAYGVIRAIETKGLLWQLSFLKGLPLGQCVGQTLLWWHYQFRYSLVTYWEPSRKCQHSNYVLPSNQQQGQENVKICHDGQNRPHFFQKFALKKTALVIQIACLCWLIIERQNCCDKTM